MYKTETHLHTSQVSLCAKLSAEEMVQLYADAGYSTIIITDHFSSRTLQSFQKDTWDACIDRFMEGYQKAKAEGLKRGIHVLFAAEITFDDAPNDYLAYGVNETFLKGHKNLYEMGIEKFSALAKRKWNIVNSSPSIQG